MKPDKKLYKRCEEAVDNRLSGKRLKHVHSVSEFAAQLAHVYGVNEFDAKIAGLLHDWDKLLKDEEFPARMEELGITPPDHVEFLWPVLHSFTGAEAVHREFPELSDDIISSIRNHTLGAIKMSDLDMVIFISDIIEPRRKAYAGIQELRDEVGKVDLSTLYFHAYQQTMRSLIDRGRFIHPAAFDIWNGLVEANVKLDKSKQGDPNVVL